MDFTGRPKSKCQPKISSFPRFPPPNFSLFLHENCKSTGMRPFLKISKYVLLCCCAVLLNSTLHAHPQQNSPSSTLNHRLQELYRAESSGDSLVSATLRMEIGELYQTELSEYDSALIYEESALEIFAVLGNKTLEARVLFNIGAIHNARGSGTKAMQALIRAANIRESIGQDSLNDEVYYEMAAVFVLFNEYDQHRYYLLKSREIATKYDHKEELAAINMSLSGVYETEGQYDSTLYYSELAFEISKELDDPILTALALLNMGLAESALGNLDKAMPYFEQMLATPNLPPLEEARFHYFIGYALFNHEKYREAESHLSKAWSIATGISARQMELRILNYLLDTYGKLNRFEDAYLVANAYKKLAKEFHDTNLEQEIAELNLKYENERKEKDLLALQAENVKQELTLFKTRSEARQRWWWGLTATIFLLLLIASFFSFSRHSQHRRTLSEREATLRREKLHQLKQKEESLALQAMLEGEESERARVAQELHDGVGVLLSSLKLSLKQRVRSTENVTHSYKLVDKASSELRRIAHNMMPEALSKFGLTAAVDDLCDEINYSGVMQVTFLTFGAEKAISRDVALQVYRIIQELLNNIIKHASATEALVQMIQRQDQLYITVEDNGRGFEPSVRQEGGNGLGNIQSRVDFLNGKLSWDTTPGGGTTVSIEFHLATTEEEQFIPF